MLFLYTPAFAGGFFEEQLARPSGSANGPEANEMRRRHGWEIVESAALLAYGRKLGPIGRDTR